MSQDIEEKAIEAINLKYEIDAVEQHLEKLKQKLHLIIRSELPTMMMAAGIDRLGIPWSGRAPSFDIRLSPYYNANIAAKWDDSKRQKAFDTLKQLDAEDLIKTDVSVSFPRGEMIKAIQVQDELSQMGLSPQLRETVHFKTLTAWLKDQCETGHMPALEQLQSIGADIGHIVNIKERDDG